jgi:fructokinase
MNTLYGGMEGGGTKFICAVGSGSDDIIEEVRIPTTTPGETLGRAIAFFKKFNLFAIGLAPFGPLDLDLASPSYGSMTATPKPGWGGTNVVTEFKRTFDIPIAIDLDVNAAALGEYSSISKTQALDSLVYFTIGTGIGAGIIINGTVIHGLNHPEAGHMRIPHAIKKDPFPGICPFHGDCFEGLASGPALAVRWRKPAERLPDSHPAWEQEATYIAYALVNMILIISSQRIVLRGGVMEHRSLFPTIREKVKKIMNGYIDSPVLAGSMESFIVPPVLGKLSGVAGALELARIMLENRSDW